jgi:predicted nucleic acid-binding protein
MGARRTHIVIPEPLVNEIDRLVGKRGRSEFLAHAAEKELRRLQQIKALEDMSGAWKDKDHPELKAGAAHWVRELRRENERRLQKVAKRYVATYLLDTSVIIDALNNKRNRRDLLLGLLKQGHLLACCPINVSEVYAGLRPKEEAATEEFLRTLEYYHVTWPVARVAGLLKRDYSRKGIALTIADTTVAAVALFHELTLMTDNTKDFPMKKLALYPLPSA